MIYNLGPRGLRVHRVAVGQGRPPPVPLRAAQVGDRRRRGRLPGGVQAHARGVRPAVRQVPEGSLQAVPRQGAAGRLRPQPRARTRRRRRSRSALLRRAVALRRPDRRRHRQPPRRRSSTSCWCRPRTASVIRNLTKGFDQDTGFEFIVHARRPLEHGAVAVVVAGGRSAGLLRPHREVAHADPAERARRRHRAALRRCGRSTSPSRPTSRPTAARWRSRRCRAASATSSSSTSTRGEVTNLTKDAFADSAPTWSPDGRSIVYMARISGNEKLFRLDIDTGKKTQLTFGTHDDAAAQFLDADTLVFSSTATEPDAADRPRRRAQRQHLQHLDAEPEDRRAAAVHRRGRRQRLAGRAAATSKGQPHRLRQLLQGRIRAAHARAHATRSRRRRRRDFGAPAARSSTSRRRCRTRWSPRTSSKKGTFEKLFLDGRPPVNVGVTSGGDIFGGTAVTFSDVLGDKQFNIYAASISQYRTLSFSYLNLARRFNYALQGYSQTQFFYGQLEGVFYDPAFSPASSTATSPLATRTVRGGSAFGIWPFNRYRRLELFGGVAQLQRAVQRPGAGGVLEGLPGAGLRHAAVPQRHLVPLGVTFVQETTVFREFGPLAGNTMRLSLRGRAEDRRHAVAADRRRRRALLPCAWAARACWRCAARGFKSWGDAPDFMYFGGNSEMRGYEYLEFLGHNVVLPQRRAALPAHRGDADAAGRARRRPRRVLRRHGRRALRRPAVQVGRRARPSLHADRRVTDVDPATGTPIPIYGPPVDIDGFRLARWRALLRHRPRDVRAGLPHPLRLGVADARSTRTGRTRCSPRSAAARSSGGRSSRCGSGTTSN